MKNPYLPSTMILPYKKAILTKIKEIEHIKKLSRDLSPEEKEKWLKKMADLFHQELRYTNKIRKYHTPENQEKPDELIYTLLSYYLFLDTYFKRHLQEKAQEEDQKDLLEILLGPRRGDIL